MPDVLECSWVAISGVVSRVTISIAHIKGLMTVLVTTHEPPSEVQGLGFRVYTRAEIFKGNIRAVEAFYKALQRFFKGTRRRC